MIKKIALITASLAVCHMGLASNHSTQSTQSAKTKKHATRTTKTKKHATRTTKAKKHSTHTSNTKHPQHHVKSKITSYAPPILLGTWKSHATIMNAKGMFNLLDWTLTVNNQSNNFLSGTSSWTIGSNFQTKDHQPITHQGSEPFIGLFSQQPKHFFLAQTNEHSILQGQVIDKNHIKLQYIEAGPNAAVAEGVFTRQAEQTPVAQPSPTTKTQKPETTTKTSKPTTSAKTKSSKKHKT